MSDLLKINVNDHTEKKNGLTYLSWAWAWAEALKVDPQARWEVRTFNGSPYCAIGDSAMVCVEVVLKGMARECWLPVMDNRNKAIKNPDAFAVNTAIMRCMTKALGMHGLGLYIYAGEDLPETEEKDAKPGPVNPTAEVANGWAAHASPERIKEMDDLSAYLIDCHENGKDMDAIRVWYTADTFGGDEEARAYVWSNLKPYSKLRSTIKANRPEERKAA